MTTGPLGTLGKSGLVRRPSGWKRRGRQRLAPSSHLKDLVKNARTLWNQLLQDLWGPADALGKPVPSDEFSIVSEKTIRSLVILGWPFRF